MQWQITFILLLTSIASALCFTNSFRCGSTSIRSKFEDDRDQTLAIDFIQIDIDPNDFMIHDTLFFQHRVFPKHNITFSANLIDDRNKLVTSLGLQKLTNVVTSYYKEPAGYKVLFAFCKINLVQNYRQIPKTQIPDNVVRVLERQVASCVQSGICNYPRQTAVAPPMINVPRITKPVTVNALVDFITTNILRRFPGGLEIPLNISGSTFSVDSLTLNQRPQVNKIADLFFEHHGPNYLKIRGFYDVSADFFLSNVHAVHLVTAQKLPVNITNAQVAFEFSLNFVDNTVKFELDNLEIFNLNEAFFVDFNKFTENKSSWSIGSIVGWALTTATKYGVTKSMVYKPLIIFVRRALAEAVESFNWENFVANTIVHDDKLNLF